MKLEKLLAENMLRFGVKNLNNTDVHQILTIMEQAAASGTESSTVTSMPAYKPVMDWWQKKSKNSSSAKKSLEYWSGGVAKESKGINVNATNTLLKHLQTLIKNNVYNLDATKLSELIKYLQTNISANIYFEPRNFDQRPESRAIRVLAMLKPEADPSKTSLAGNEKSAIDAFNKADLNKIKASLEKTQFVYTTITETDKIALLKYFEEKATQKATVHNKTNADNPLGKLIQWDMEKAIKEASSIRIGPGEGSIEREAAADPTPPEIFTYTFSYPDISEANPKLQNFFLGDDNVAVSAENEAAFKETLETLLSSIPADQKIIEVYIKAGSSTSKVPTSYKSAGKYTTAANVTLVDDRLTAIQTSLSNVVDTTIPKGEWNLIVDPPERKPNNGPEWTEADRNAYPLDKRRVKNPDGQPNPKFNQKIVDAYEAKYGRYKGSYGQISIKTTSTEIKTTITEPSVLVSGAWYGSMTWPSPGKGDGKPKTIPGKNKGEKTWTGQGTLDCPVFGG
jgi:hypothetical protein